MKNNPAISVIIPVYNAANFLGDCLDSVLNQTFQDFEVIVVDDCSTDNSVEVVGNFAKKFGGRLKLLSTEKNSGGGGYVPRNKGLENSRGEYIYFVDADDLIIKTALENLYAVAEKFALEVIYTSSCYTLNAAGEIQRVSDTEGENLSEDNPDLTLDNPEENLRRLLFSGNLRTPWSKFVRRDFLLDNEIIFPQIISGGDFIWTIHVACCAKKFLRLPKAFYVYRVESEGSVSRKKRSPEKQIAHWLKAFVYWTEALAELANKIDFLKKTPAYCYMATDQHFDICFKNILEERLQVSSYDIYEIMQQEFADKAAAYAYLIPYFLNVIDAYQKFGKGG